MAGHVFGSRSRVVFGGGFRKRLSIGGRFSLSEPGLPTRPGHSVSYLCAPYYMPLPRVSSALQYTQSDGKAPLWGASLVGAAWPQTKNPPPLVMKIDNHNHVAGEHLWRARQIVDHPLDVDVLLLAGTFSL